MATTWTCTCCAATQQCDPNPDADQIRQCNACQKIVRVRLRRASERVIGAVISGMRVANIRSL